MSTAKELVEQILSLPRAERERLARIAWESLAESPDAAADASVDAAGLEIAEQRDADLDAGSATAVDDEEFRRRTGGG